MKYIFGLLLAISILSCKKEASSPIASSTNFTVQGTNFTESGVLPKDYTCDGTSSSPALSWQNPPSGTISYAVVMHHIPPSPESTHVYLLLYNISSTVLSIAKNTSGVGLFGVNTVNGKTQYSPPCSQGPGAKSYVITVYALSAAPVFSVPQAQVTRDLLLTAISKTTLGSAVLNVTYTRP